MKIHIVKTGDTLYLLSQKYGVPLEKIIEANPQISNPNVLAIGDKVKIPSAPVPVPDNSEVYYKHTVKQGDTLWKLSKAWGIPLKEMIEANPQLKNPNALMTGEVVNIPKKATSLPVQSSDLPPNASNAANNVDKTQIGGKTYTGPIEEPVETATPAPIPAPVNIPKPTPNVAAEVTPAPVPVPLPNKPAEVSPIHEKMVTETQSLYVQISVPAQEAVSYHTMPKAEVQPVSFEPKVTPCNKTAGYPGLMENPNFYDCPPAYPFYEPLSNMNINTAPNFMQPAFYVPDCMSPYYYPENIHPLNNIPESWHSNASPNVSGMNPNTEYPAYVSPQYTGQSPNLPWPSCGCGGNTQLQPYSYEMPMYNNFPGYVQPNAYSPYGIGMPQMPNQGLVPTAPLGAFGGAAISNIPSYPQYPGIDNYGQHNRVPEIQEPEPIVQEIQQAAGVVSSEATVLEGNVKGKSSGPNNKGPKAKTSSQKSKPNKTTSKSQHSNQSKQTNAAKRSRNPWISN
ncbi:LysM peptidoglycan-binding domain-containing protein [Paenibacillus sp. 19GGS1-52]|uniref:LysM peptidoglycan-binding domain-containing protein n=1 Tax=Paenibacillus sp. 19GGS1-52 TaxID=2758563 RepID=UPI001EFAD2BA|nr:LysM peptidoglycan-binding domain-containing protein [Paenibacillus sp. 19GGS1-52]ULO08698.1 LysM peptidoglycan-binding domain-containing protein [Paenibacillus sp. 19GGS1-52]